MNPTITPIMKQIKNIIKTKTGKNTNCQPNAQSPPEGVNIVKTINKIKEIIVDTSSEEERDFENIVFEFSLALLEKIPITIRIMGTIKKIKSPDLINLLFNHINPPTKNNKTENK